MHYGWVILAFGVLTTLSAIGLARFGYTMILPSMQAGLGLTNTEAGALATGNMVGYLALALIGGFLASHFSPRRVITLALLVVGATMVLTGLSGRFTSALLWRTLTGMGSGGSNVPMMGLLAAWFAAKRRGLATGLAVTGSSLGLIITGPLVPFILKAANENGWRYSWFVLGAMVLCIAVLVHLLLRDRPEEKGLEPIGAEAVPDGAAQNSRPDPPRGVGAWALVYKSGVVWHLSLIYAAFGFSYIIYATFFAKYLHAEMGFSEKAAGNLWQIVGWISIASSLLWGWISDILGRKFPLAIVSATQACAYLMFAVWATPVGLTTSAILFGLTAWSIPAIMASACGDQLGPRMAPAALGFVTLFLGIGQAVGPSVAGRIADQAGSFAPAFVVAMAAALVGAVASLLLRDGLKNTRH